MKSVSHSLGSYRLLFVIALAAGCGSGSGTPTETVGTMASALTGANGIKADVVLDSQWAQGYCARIVVGNDHPTATTGSWSVTLDVGPGTTFTTWDGVFSGNTGIVTVTPQSANAVTASDTIVAGSRSTSAGRSSTWSGTVSASTTCACSG